MRLWIPLLPVFLVLSPLLALALVVFVAACLVVRIDPVRALHTGWRLLCSLSGTRIDDITVDVDQPEAKVQVYCE